MRYGGIAQLVERLLCKQNVRSSNLLTSNLGVLAQLVRASPCHGEGCGFESRKLRIYFY
jgi:hypothetical protein